MRRTLLLSLLVACHTPPAKIPTPAPPPQTFDVAAIDTWVAAQVKERGEVGAALVIVQDGKIVLAKGYGTKVAGQDAPPDADTPFAIGSISKELTCAAALSLVDDGKLTMQDKVATYYPALTSAADITLDDLAGHVSGYRDVYPLDFKDARMTNAIAPDDLLHQYAGLPLDFPPRTKWSYSNTGYTLLARVVEKVSGQPLPDLLAARVFGPLGMHATIGAPAGAATGHHAFYFNDAAPTAPESDGWLYGAGEVYASANDLEKWDLALMNGTILSDASRRYMMTPHILSDGRSTDYGCGLEIDEKHGDTVLSHSGEVEGFLAYHAFVPRTRSAVILLTNDGDVDGGDLLDTITDLLTRVPNRAPTVDGPAPVDAATALIRQLQAGQIDRATLGDDFAGYLEANHLATRASALRALGAPTVTLVRTSERGGMEVSVLDVAFAGGRDLKAVMFRSTDGKIHELWFLP